MGTKIRTPKIASLCDEYPFPIKNLNLIGLKLKDEITPAIVVNKNGDSFCAGITLYADETEAGINFDEKLELCDLPKVMISTKTMAEAMNDPMSNLDPQELVEYVFAAVIALTGKVEIEFEEVDPDDLKNAFVRFSVEAGKFKAETTRPYLDLRQYLDVVDEEE